MNTSNSFSLLLESDISSSEEMLPVKEKDLSDTRVIRTPKDLKRDKNPIRVDEDLYNPTLIVDPITYNQKTYNIIRDDYLSGGTKQRGMVPLMEHSNATEFVYAGPTTGYAQIALAYAAKLTGKNATIIVNKDKHMHPFTRKAFDFGANVIPIQHGHLQKIQAKAVSYVNNRAYAELIPFGGSSPEFMRFMQTSIENALPPVLQDLIEDGGPKRMWIVGGSATLLNVLYKVFPKTYFTVIQIGKKIWDDQLDLTRTTKHIAIEKFKEPATFIPPYPSVSTYDAKLWIFAAQYGKDGDYIWNVAAD